VTGAGHDGGAREGQARAFRLPDSLGGKLWVWRYIILRRVVQLLVLVLFVGTFRQGWTLAGSPILRGNLSGSELLGFVPLADPFAVAQLLLARGAVASRVLIGAGVVLLFYVVVGGRTFCSWVCPVNPVADLAGWLRRKLNIRSTLRPPRSVRHWVMGLALLLSALLGVAAFEWVSPIGMLHRGLVFGMGLGWVAVAAVFVFDLLVVRFGWCGHLCPLGAFYGLFGRAAQVRIAYDADTCTQCGECAVVCPEPHVLNLKQAAEVGMIASGDCTNCGRCTPVCPEGSLRFGWRMRI
jgi:ferredoxin-type protein NapH